MIDSKTIVVCDIKQCLNCGNCIAACKRRHKDISRHVRERSALIGISLIPNLCKICRNPRCIETCNRHGVERDEDGNIVVTDNCVGCGLCMRSCPYNAILVFSQQEQDTSYMKKILSFIRPDKKGKSQEQKDEGSIDTKRLDTILDKYPKSPSSLMPILQDIQIEFNYLPKESLIYVSNNTDIPLSQVYNVATFYNAFSLVPRGRHIISVCMGTACHVRGAGKILSELERRLGIMAGETTQDMKFTLESVNCLGACALGPVMVIDGEYFGKVSPDKISSILEKFD